MEASKKVIILDNIKSNRIAWAIFVLKDGETDEFSAVREAEAIVSDYLSGKPLFRKKKSNLKRIILIFLACLSFSAALFFALHGV